MAESSTGLQRGMGLTPYGRTLGIFLMMSNFLSCKQLPQTRNVTLQFYCVSINVSKGRSFHTCFSKAQSPMGLVTVYVMEGKVEKIMLHSHCHRNSFTVFCL